MSLPAVALAAAATSTPAAPPNVTVTDAALETADVALMSDDLAKLPWLVRRSLRTLNVIRQNIAFALGV